MSEIPQDIREGLSRALHEGDEEVAEEITRRALGEGIDPLEIIQEVLVPTLSEVGMNFQELRIFLPELMLSGAAASRAGDLLEEAILAQGKELRAVGKVVLGTVEGDIHDIGQNIIGSLLNANGFEVISLGRDVKPSTFREVAEDQSAETHYQSFRRGWSAQQVQDSCWRRSCYRTLGGRNRS
jgi:methanogenic corrinoid protein MtbC1